GCDGGGGAWRRGGGGWGSSTPAIGPEGGRPPLLLRRPPGRRLAGLPRATAGPAGTSLPDGVGCLRKDQGPGSGAPGGQVPGQIARPRRACPGFGEGRGRSTPRGRVARAQSE